MCLWWINWNFSDPKMHATILQHEMGSTSACITRLEGPILTAAMAMMQQGWLQWRSSGWRLHKRPGGRSCRAGTYTSAESFNRIYADGCRWRTKMRQLTQSDVLQEDSMEQNTRHKSCLWQNYRSQIWQHCSRPMKINSTHPSLSCRCEYYKGFISNVHS